MFCKKCIVWSILKWFNPILCLKNTSIGTEISLILCVVTEILMKTKFSVMAALIWLFCTTFWCDLYWSSLIWIFTPQNTGIDTEIIPIPCTVTEIGLLMKTRFSLIVALICILRGLPNDDRVVCIRILKGHASEVENSKKTLHIPTIIPYCKVLNRTS